ncbi:MAG: SCP2 sterol-binding domain-containing protein [bacterium]
MAVTCKEVFDAMPKGFDPEEAGDWAATLQYNIEGEGGGNWVVKIEGGKCEVTEGSAESPTATVETDAETWCGIVEGTVEPTTAFMTGKIRIQGNMADVMKSQKVFKKERIQ